MDIPSLILGVLAAGFGLVTIIVRFVKPESFRKLQRMQETWGKGTGTLVHVVFYSILPIAVGTVAIIAGLRGISFL